MLVSFRRDTKLELRNRFGATHVSRPQYVIVPQGVYTRLSEAVVNAYGEVRRQVICANRWEICAKLKRDVVNFIRGVVCHGVKQVRSPTADDLLRSVRQLARPRLVVGLEAHTILGDLKRHDVLNKKYRGC